LVKKLYAPDPTGGAVTILPFGSVMYGPSKIARFTVPVAVIEKLPLDANIPVELKGRAASTETVAE